MELTVAIYRASLQRALLQGGPPSAASMYVVCLSIQVTEDPAHEGCEVVLYLILRKALQDGAPFFMSSNGVLLSPGIDGVVPAKYVSRVWDRHGQTWMERIAAWTRRRSKKRLHRHAAGLV